MDQNQMNQNQNLPMSEKELTHDLLTSQKDITGVYNTSANESASPELRSTLLNILQEEHGIQATVFDQMQKRGWYPVTPAPQQKIDTAKQKFTNQATS